MSDTHGNFSFDLPPGDWNITIRASSGKNFVQQISVFNGRVYSRDGSQELTGVDLRFDDFPLEVATRRND